MQILAPALRLGWIALPAALLDSAAEEKSLADLRSPALGQLVYAEFLETGMAKSCGYTSPADMIEKYPAFFWGNVEPYIGDALRYLQVTQEGKQWIANLYAHVFSEEHRGAFGGPFR